MLQSGRDEDTGLVTADLTGAAVHLNHSSEEDVKHLLGREGVRERLRDD
jgi:hypothetical protein